ncbi:MAG: hypothetical protein IPJ34_43330 [Myxococcales bacterium]|nr:hypothetical protein [Myxococcales bacterium]
MELLKDVTALLDPAFGTKIRVIAAAFLFDADAALAQREATFAQEYAELLRGVDAPTHGTWVKTPPAGGLDVVVGLYVFHDPIHSKGTLEELLAPLVAADGIPAGTPRTRT